MDKSCHSIHFIGVSGIGMSALAAIFALQGYKVQGSDSMLDSSIASFLAKSGVKLFAGHNSRNVEDADLIIVSTAISEENVELKTARSLNKRIMHRSEALKIITDHYKLIAVSGAHGKTTTTAMTDSVLSTLPHQTILGGILNSNKLNFNFHDEAEYIVAELDESDGSMVAFHPTIAVITNIDRDHLEHHQGFEGMIQTFVTLLAQTTEHIIISSSAYTKVKDFITNRKVSIFGEVGFDCPQAKILATDIILEHNCTKFSVVLDGRLIPDFSLPMPGMHNINNALAAILVGDALNISTPEIKRGISNYAGVEKRFSILGEFKGSTVIDDYAHNPSKIAAALEAAYQFGGMKRRIIAVVEPHRFTRIHALFDEFIASLDRADVIIFTEIFSGGESPISGCSSPWLVEALRRRGKIAYLANNLEDLKKILSAYQDEENVIIFQGAGKISKMAHALVEAA